MINRLVVCIAGVIMMMTLPGVVPEGAAQTNAGSAGSFLRLGLGARAIGKANTAPTGARDAYGFYYNAAALPMVSGRHFGTAYGFLPLDRVYHYVGFATALPPTAGIGVGWMATGVDDIQGRDFNGEKTRTYAVRQNTFLVGFGNRFSEQIQVGALFKIIRNDLDELSATAVAVDVGVIITPFEWVSLGLMAGNFNGEFSWDTEGVYSQGTTTVNAIPVVGRAGATFRMIRDLEVMVEYERTAKGAVVYRAAAEWHPMDMTAIRAGMADGEPRFGAGLEYGFLAGLDTALDYALAFGRAGEGPSHYFSWSFRF